MLPENVKKSKSCCSAENVFLAETGFQPDSQCPMFNRGFFTQIMKNGHDYDHFHRGWHHMLV
jgi:hypothetical protein